MTLSSESLHVRASAPAKINLGLFVGPVRDEDGRHELASVMQSISLADELTLESVESVESVESAPGAGDPRTFAHANADVSGAGEDEIVCPGVPGPPGENLAAEALRLFRQATGWDVGPLRLSIVKRIPVAAGLGGGSADAAATLRLARHASGLGSDELLLALGARLGADVPAQIAPGRWLATGAAYLVPNFSAFNIINQAAHGDAVPGRLILYNTAYALLYSAMTISGAVLIFQRRNLK